ncbi:hypothetical protein HW555_013087, partial [Spodoptera exigua]
AEAARKATHARAVALATTAAGLLTQARCQSHSAALRSLAEERVVCGVLCRVQYSFAVVKDYWTTHSTRPRSAQLGPLNGGSWRPGFRTAHARGVPSVEREKIGRNLSLPAVVRAMLADAENWREVASFCETRDFSVLRARGDRPGRCTNILNIERLLRAESSGDRPGRCTNILNIQRLLRAESSGDRPGRCTNILNIERLLRAESSGDRPGRCTNILNIERLLRAESSGRQARPLY